jgi:2-iminobutanoate/2-iminopropanoate deaminase
MRKEAEMSNGEHRPIQTPDLPAPAGPYSPAQAFNRLVFVSGQGATDPSTGRLAGEDIESQTEQVLKNVSAILEAAGSNLQHVLRCGVFLTDMAEFARMNAVYARMFDGHRPARTTVQVSELPMRGLRVEIDAIAYIP